jgi:CDP-2,3-bis-(O-geranylgeranyl)-sn-glycerol synthase
VRSLSRFAHTLAVDDRAGGTSYHQTGKRFGEDLRALMHPALVAKLVILLAVANGAPVLAKKALATRFDRPLDGGAIFVDGRPLFGPSKTIRGLVVSLLATPFAAVLLGLQWEVGTLVAAGAIAGDLLSSFVKRRLGLASSSMAIGLDQIPEALIPALLSCVLLPLDWLDILGVVMLFFVANLVLSPPVPPAPVR